MTGIAIDDVVPYHQDVLEDRWEGVDEVLRLYQGMFLHLICTPHIAKNIKGEDVEITRILQRAKASGIQDNSWPILV